MSERVCLVHYHEIGLKGKNRSIFENQLVTNLKCALRDTPLKCVKRICGYILVTFEGGATRDYQDLIGKVPGVARVSLAHECPRDLAEYSQAAIVSLGEAGSFSPSISTARWAQPSARPSLTRRSTSTTPMSRST